MEARIKNLERKMDEFERLLRGQHQTQTRGQSPPRRVCQRIETEAWNGGIKRTHERCSPACFEDGSLRRREGFSWGSRPLDSSWNSGHPRHHDGGKGRAIVNSGRHQTVRVKEQNSSHNREACASRESKEPLSDGQPLRKPPDLETATTIVAESVGGIVNNAYRCSSSRGDQDSSLEKRVEEKNHRSTKEKLEVPKGMANPTPPLDLEAAAIISEKLLAKIAASESLPIENLESAEREKDVNEEQEAISSHHHFSLEDRAKDKGVGC